jgi:cell differentiation family Rcd1-like protein
MVNQLVETQAVRLLKHVVRCYLRLSDNPRAREALRACLPEPLRDNTFAALLQVSYPSPDDRSRRILRAHRAIWSQNVVSPRFSIISMTNKCIIYPLLSSLLRFPNFTRSPPVVATVPITYLRFAFSSLDVCLGVYICHLEGRCIKLHFSYVTNDWSKEVGIEICVYGHWFVPCRAKCLMTTSLSPKRVSTCPNHGFLYLDGQLLKPRYTRAQKRVDTLNDAVQFIILLWRGGSKLYMQRANQAACVLWPKMWVRVRRKPLDRNELPNPT